MDAIQIVHSLTPAASSHSSVLDVPFLRSTRS